MPCIDCQNLKLKQAKGMARMGYGLCAHRPAWQFISVESTCERLTPAPAGLVKARKDFLANPSRQLPSTESKSKPTEQPEVVSRETKPAPTPTPALKDSTGQLAFS